GRLSNDGEEIELRDAENDVVDEVDYQRGFPWPVCPDGASMELIHPSLDNDLGGSWRSSSFSNGFMETTYLAPADTGWRYFKGLSEPPSPGGLDWRSTNYTENASWLTGQTPIGYGDGDDNTVLNDMRFNYSSVYLRHSIFIPPGQMPEALLLRIYVDDGAIVYFNGMEVDRWHVDPGPQAFNDTANNHEREWEEMVVNNPAAFLNEGTNMIAIHALNATVDSSDFSIDLELRSTQVSGGSPSPNAINNSFSSSAPPQIRQVRHTPEQPVSGTNVTITAKVTDPDGVLLVSLSYQDVDPGSYIRLTDAAYNAPANWTSVGMRDDGLAGDAVAGDDTWTVVLAPSVQIHRRLVRYRITVTDVLANSIQTPYPDDPQPNFAYFVYDGVPDWTGADEPGVSPTTNFPASVMDPLPVYHLIANNTDVDNSQYVGAFDGDQFKGTLVYDGEVYDHIEFHNRGEFSTYVSGKNKWRLRFTLSHEIEVRDDYGKKHNTRKSVINLNAAATPWIPVHRGMGALDETVAFKLFELADVITPKLHWIQYRIIDSVDEAPPGNQYGGDLWGLYHVVEHPDGDFLRERDLPSGNLYKAEGGSGDKKHQGSTHPLDDSDWTGFRSASGSLNTVQWWRDNLHLDSYYTFRAI
ncbi:MAG: hypothetical protein AAF492_14460, partial [Verrucomicrobiota bacterium]